MRRRPPPETLAELELRARALAGRTLSELADALAVALPADPRRAKGIPGQLVERALGAAGGGAPRPDFEALGVELKTIPVGPDGRPRESTFVCQIDPIEIAHEEWPTSRCRRKLAHVLWLPIASQPLPLSLRTIGTPLLWRPSPAEEAELRADWEELAGLVATGVEPTAHRGRHLQVRPKAANARARRWAIGPDEVPFEALPRGFYLRSSFTARILG